MNALHGLADKRLVDWLNLDGCKGCFSEGSSPGNQKKRLPKFGRKIVGIKARLKKKQDASN